MRPRLILLFATAFCLASCLSVFSQSYAITNAKIVTVSGSTIEKGTVVVRNGLIDSVSANSSVPADAAVIDGTGLTVYPGFIDALTNLGLQATAPRPAGGPAAVPNAAATPSSNSNYPAGLRPEDSSTDDLRAGEAQFEASRNAGITTVLTVSKNGIFNGRSAVIDLAGDSVSAMIVRSSYAEHVSFATIGGGYPGSLLGTFSALRQMFYDAQRLEAWQKAYAANPKGMKRPDADRSLEALIPLLSRQTPVVFNANREIEIVRSLDLIKEFKLNGVIAGGQEAWKVADRLKSQNVAVLFSLNLPKRTAAASPEADPDTLETLRFRAETPAGPGKLAAAGVKFAFQSGGAASISDLFINAGKTVEAGLNRDAAIRAMTLGAAELLGVSNVTGSIDAGKIANLAVVRGDVFGKDRFVPFVFVDGKLFEQKEPPKAPAGRPNGGLVAPGVPNISGSYSITIDIPGQPLPSTLNLVQSGSVLSGTMVSALGTTQIKDGKVTTEGFAFAASVVFGGTPIDIALRGTVSGNQINGTLDSPQGSVGFSGTKVP